MLRTIPKKKITFPEGHTLIMRVADGKFFAIKRNLTPDFENYTNLLPMDIVSEDDQNIHLQLISTSE